MGLQNRIENLNKLCDFLNDNDATWQSVKELAFNNNQWFLPVFIDNAVNNIVKQFLDINILNKFAQHYNISENNNNIKKVGIVMAGNIPLVGFHDLLCAYISGNKILVKLAQKDSVLMQYIIDVLNKLNKTNEPIIETAEMLKACDAYIATGSNNTARYFEQYFTKYANIIRQSKTSVAILTGIESPEELKLLACDIVDYFGLGCRCITKIYVPQNYNFENLLEALKTKTYIHGHNKYKNNFDYNLALYLLNNAFYMTEGNILLVENESLFSPIATIHYEFYTDANTLEASLKTNNNIQAIVGKNHLEFGTSQSPTIYNYADGEDTMAFLVGL